MPQVNLTPVKEKETPENPSDGTPLGKSVSQQFNEEIDNSSIDTPMAGFPVSDSSVHDDGKNETDGGKLLETLTEEGTVGEAVIPTPNGDLNKESAPEVGEGNSLPLLSQKIEITCDDRVVEAGPDLEIEAVETFGPPKIDQESSQSENVDVIQPKATDAKVEPPAKQVKQEDQKTDALTSMKVQEQLDEVKYLILGEESGILLCFVFTTGLCLVQLRVLSP